MDTKQLQLENETLNARLDKAKEVFRQQAKDIKAKDEAYLKLRDEYNEVIRERDIHIEANAKFNKQILEAEALIKELKESQEKQQELADASYDREAYVGQIDGLNDKIDELTEAVKYWEEKYHKLSEAHSTESTELNDLKTRNAELEGLANARLTDINKSKEYIFLPHESWNFLGIKYQDKIVDLSDITLDKIDSVNLNGIFKKGKSNYYQVRVMYMIIVATLSYLVVNFVYDFLGVFS